MPVHACGHCAKMVELPENWTSPGFMCPRCHLSTELVSAGAAPLPLPHEPAFVAPADTERGNSGRRAAEEAKGKLLIYLGYAAFTVVPAIAVIALAAYKFGEDGKRDDEPKVVQNSGGDKDRPTPKTEPIPRPIPRPPVFVPKPKDTGIEEPRPGKKEPEPIDPKMIETISPMTTVAIAPAPHEPRPAPVPEPIAVAPEPHVARPDGFTPPSGFTTDWTVQGAVELRLSGVAIRRVPITNADSRDVDSPVPVLTVWVEVRLRQQSATRELRRWQDSLGSYAELTTMKGLVLGRGLLGPGATLRTGLPYKQPLPADGTPRIDVLVFASPSEEAGDLKLTLDGERVGETGTFKVVIPAAVWKK